MPIDQTKIAIAVAQGLSVVCATCEKYWQARDRNVPDGRCLAQDGCGSPIAGDVFHEYVGPMPHFDQWCFVCGGKSTHAIRVDNHVRVVGCCREHVDMVRRLKPAGKNAARVVLVSKDEVERVDEDSVQPPISLKFGG